MQTIPYMNTEHDLIVCLDLVSKLIAFVTAPLASEAEVEAAVKMRLGYPPPSKQGLGVVEVRPVKGPGDNGTGSPPDAVAPVDAEVTQRVRPAAWVGEPLPSPSTGC